MAEDQEPEFREDVTMPRDAITLTDVRKPVVVILCEPCDRRGRYSVERPIAKHLAEMRLPELRTILADCPEARAFSIYDRRNVCCRSGTSLTPFRWWLRCQLNRRNARASSGASAIALSGLAPTGGRRPSRIQRCDHVHGFTAREFNIRRA